MIYRTEEFRRLEGGKGPSVELILSCESPDDIAVILSMYLMLPSAHPDRPVILSWMAQLRHQNPSIFLEGAYRGWDRVFSDLEPTFCVSERLVAKVKGFAEKTLSKKPYLVLNTIGKISNASLPHEAAIHCAKGRSINKDVCMNCELLCSFTAFHLSVGISKDRI